jgi:hypothetical protein
MKYVITEAEKREILGLYGIHREEKTPLQMLAECKFTSDGKFVIYEGIGYSCETGDQVPINEAWTLSDTLHTIGDLASAASDFIVPGSGAIIDGVNALSYFIEAMATKDPEKKKSLLIMGGITLAFVLIPGPLQAVSTPLKQFVKTGKMVKNAAVANGIKIVGKSMAGIMNAVPALVKKILNSKLGQRVLGKYGAYLTRYIDDIMKGVKATFDNFATQTGKVGVKAAAKETLDKLSIRALLGFSKNAGKVAVKNGTKVLRKAGFAVGRSYRYMGPKGMTTVVIKEISDNAVIITGKFGQAAPSIGTFLNQAIGAPWLRRGKSVYVPLFIKRFTNMLLPEGNGINEAALDQMPDADPDVTSQESLGFTNEEVAAYQGTQGTYTVNNMVSSFQKALMALGYNLPRFGVDGKFGPETQEQLKSFQRDYQLESSSGKMDRATAKMLAQALVDKNVQDSEDIQSALNAA